MMMQAGTLWRRLVKRLLRRHGTIKSFDAELRTAGGEAGRRDRGLDTVPTEKIVGSVGRARNLRSDFFYRRGKAMTARFVRVGQAMRDGTSLPPLELYKVKRPPRDAQAPPPGTEYYVLDGHHRVAMARKLGQDFLDAHVVEYQVGAHNLGTPEGAAPGALPPADQRPGPAAAAPPPDQRPGPAAAAPPPDVSGRPGASPDA